MGEPEFGPSVGSVEVDALPRDVVGIPTVGRVPVVAPALGEARRGAGAPYVLRVSEQSRPAADALCARLRKAGGACVVLRNPT